MKTQLDHIRPFRTKDGSLIRELMHPVHHGNAKQSLAHATVEAGNRTYCHYHRNSEELYHITSGRCEVFLDDKIFKLEVGDTLLIPAGTRHYLRNSGTGSVELLCMCSPPYSHEDTVMVDEPADCVSK